MREWRVVVDSLVLDVCGTRRKQMENGLAMLGEGVGLVRVRVSALWLQLLGRKGRVRVGQEKWMLRRWGEGGGRVEG